MRNYDFEIYAIIITYKIVREPELQQYDFTIKYRPEEVKFERRRTFSNEFDPNYSIF